MFLDNHSSAFGMGIKRHRVAGLPGTWRLSIGGAAIASAIMFVRREIYLHPSRKELVAEVAQHNAIIADAARIRRNEPPSDTLIKSNAIQVENAVVVDSMPDLRHPYVLVVADDPFFAGDAVLAIRNSKEDYVDLYFIMGSYIRIFEVAQDGTPRVVDWGYVTNIEAEPK
jgi:hypothetical protein